MKGYIYEINKNKFYIKVKLLDTGEIISINFDYKNKKSLHPILLGYHKYQILDIYKDEHGKYKIKNIFNTEPLFNINDVNNKFYIGVIVSVKPTAYYIMLEDKPNVQLIAEQPLSLNLQDLPTGTKVILRLTQKDIDTQKLRGKIIKTI